MILWEKESFTKIEGEPHPSEYTMRILYCQNSIIKNNTKMCNAYFVLFLIIFFLKTPLNQYFCRFYREN